MIKFCSLFSGSSGNSIFLSANGTKLLIDAGLSARKIVEALYSIGEEPSKLNAILVTHEHIDHIRGAGVLSRKFNLPVYANENTWEQMEREIGPMNVKNKMVFNTGREFEVGEVCAKAFSIPHDAAEPVGFNFFIQDKKITTATDIGHINRELLQHFERSELLLLESNHDIEMLKVGPYPWHLKMRILGERGHLSNEMAGKVVAYLAEKGTRRFLLGHLSKENNFPELAYQTVCNELSEKKIIPGWDVTLDVVLRDRVGKVIEL
ncbi:MAG: MBL fold metallo-hydrolase [Clostridiales bacterium]|jgi:phosphoribosyl 1,2-cyclic phosphodiesterase|nr:MBL fold metallo-hydrolase [Eubacteriales bacterium]MDH7565715.1 MBL fold metallo-hydrolase [Clostridiales bacterium]